MDPRTLGYQHTWWHHGLSWWKDPCGHMHVCATRFFYKMDGYIPRSVKPNIVWCMKWTLHVHPSSSSNCQDHMASWAWSTVIVDVRACFEQVWIWGRPSSNSLRGRCFWCIQKGSYPKRRMLSGSFFRLCSGVFSIDQICANGSTCVAVVDL